MSNDLINRQAAIDAIEAVFPVDPMKSEYAQGIACGTALAKTYIEQLPSAQPEIIKCEDCLHANECHKSVQYTRNEPNATTIGYSPIEWCSNGKRMEK